MKFSSILTLFALSGFASAASLLIETETFADKGGWKVDTQFIETMGSPYLIAHGLGTPVADAITETTIPEDGTYTVWVRTIDWSERLGRAEGAGRFSLEINGQKIGGELGKGPAEWTWEKAGTADLKTGQATLTLKDLGGYDGRVDAILLSNTEGMTPPEKCMLEDRCEWKFAGAPSAAEDAGNFDLVVIGGGYGGMGAAISAARMGCKVALIQNRDVLGGNGSSEIRVWAMGEFPPGQYPLSDIIRNFTDDAGASPAPAEQFGDEIKEAVVRSEKNITLMLGHHAYGVEMKDGKIQAAKLLDVKNNRIKRVSGRLFADCTGHGFIGQWAGADLTMEDKGRMGMSNMWMWENTGASVDFREEPWMLPFKETDFPYPVRNHAQWFWESGFDKHPISELEITRDWNLVASYSAWNAIKNHGAHSARDPETHSNARMTWLAYVGGTRETQQLLGDVVLSDTDIEEGKKFPDGCVLTTWSIDLHYPKEQYQAALPEHPFISKAVHRRAVDRRIGYPIPYRCFYSRNIPNLFMAGRDISVTREALGTIRVMNTIGMMGVVVGRSAALALAHDCTPREIYEKHLDEAKTLWRFPGKKRFVSFNELRGSLNKTGSSH